MEIVAVEPKIEESWHLALAEEFGKPYFLALKKFLLAEKAAGKIIYPPGNLIFNAFNSTPYDKVKVVILGQDPYHGPGQAHGLCFSVPQGISPPPSLKNIFKELRQDLGISIPKQGDLSYWARQGVLLLNSVLTVRAGEANSHQGRGWENFTDAVIRKLSAGKKDLVFLLWGNPAKAKASLIDATKHCILTAAHPSPLSAARGFLGCRHFSLTNEYLRQHKSEPIDWCLD